MYTGKLEYVAGEKSRLCLVAKQLGMNYIIEILQKQVKSFEYLIVDGKNHLF